jgi:sugar (pentulose or hexulose) kinase
MTRPTLRVNIETLVLDGVQARDPVVGQAVRRALEAPVRMHGTTPRTAARLTGAVAAAVAGAASDGAES